MVLNISIKYLIVASFITLASFAVISKSFLSFILVLVVGCGDKKENIEVTPIPDPNKQFKNLSPNQKSFLVRYYDQCLKDPALYSALFRSIDWTTQENDYNQDENQIIARKEVEKALKNLEPINIEYVFVNILKRCSSI